MKTWPWGLRKISGENLTFDFSGHKLYLGQSQGIFIDICVVVKNVVKNVKKYVLKICFKKMLLKYVLKGFF